MAADVRTAGAKVRADTSFSPAAVEEYVRDHCLDAVVESALADPDDFRASSTSRHRIEVVALATPEAWSRLGIRVRFLTEAAGGASGRFVTWVNHDLCATNMLATLAVIEEEQLADRITVVTRDAVKAVRTAR